MSDDSETKIFPPWFDDKPELMTDPKSKPGLQRRWADGRWSLGPGVAQWRLVSDETGE